MTSIAVRGFCARRARVTAPGPQPMSRTWLSDVNPLSFVAMLVSSIAA